MASSQPTRFSLSTRSSDFITCESNPLETLLLNLTNDIPTGVIKHFCSLMSTPEELFNNTSMIVGYYLQEGCLKQFIKYLIVREIEECFRTPQAIFKRNSTYLRVLKVILENELKPFFNKAMEIVLVIIEENKSKLVIGNTGDPGVEKSLDKMKDIIYKLTELFITFNFSNTFLYFMSRALVELHARTPNVEISALRGLFFIRLLGNYLVSNLESKSAVEAESLKTVSVVLSWFAEPTEEEISEDNWKAYLKEFASDKRQSIDERILQFKNPDIDSIEIDLPWIDKEKAKDLLPRMQVEWRNVVQFVTSESGVLLQLHFSSEMETTRIYNRLINELEALSTNTKKEKSDLLLKMTSMKMEIKDLEEEIKYLRELLASRDPSLAYLKSDEKEQDN
ncbi:GTPase-activator protein for Ras family GTPase [Entamoeba histolytica HM-1:IMSS-B]|uniref:GTPase-activator protein for Ras family GTPase n=6 Tax=Entamoeba histolytica TaxID=5759 RepID=C4M3G8_ENTH1|nr:hypothetical protein EHI_017630 [Entamoeba histolytica HM-1:IMSS]EMD47016.1 gtpaseactivator protein for Ras family gtpase [Entamoeba histolytica KU27]EMH75028.1 GTPase-activator protein for Ras family GTPase [Entamoeba histolytica HM-1:IMSS-B]EMS14997.1 GTPase-activator protein for Ras family GTPase [Entamoeba histolytica HM-3:IMSS]ENY62382.1 GTPase-activator protein for Ras family GTPase, putative [Entamoeba histolytica HM-1:IMSS-A]GAT95849.1 hypothetical protein CL6EHI_017630 [Entamoeba h|eukprot:XP_652241.1 hypothetical protein EHI_017630 [Entamoeba histolytica HM-1:IMSS]